MPGEGYPGGLSNSGTTRGQKREPPTLEEGQELTDDSIAYNGVLNADGHLVTVQAELRYWSCGSQ
jgi:hypothetical protein